MVGEQRECPPPGRDDDAWAAPGERRMLVFVDSGCGHCQALLRALAESLPSAACACPVRVWVEGMSGLRVNCSARMGIDRCGLRRTRGERRGAAWVSCAGAAARRGDDRIARVLEGERSRADLERRLKRFCPPCAAP